jgi:tetratricopeptide (TPR) repeat protein
MFLRFLFIALCVALTVGCSQKKNIFTSRAFHNSNAYWNGYFNARDIYKKSLKKRDKTFRYNYRRLLPLYLVQDEAAKSEIDGEMEKVIKKCSRVIEYHGMDIGGKEHCKWVDDCWMLIGKGYYQQGNTDECFKVFEYIPRKFGNSEVKYEAELFYCNALIEVARFERADFIIKVLENDNAIPQEYMADFKATSARFHLAQNNVERAIPKLEEAIAYQKNKRIRTRWMFLLAQLYAEDGDYFRADDMFTRVIKSRPDYEMEFYAQFYRATSYNSDMGSSYEIKKTLLKMLKDDKNIDYRDKLFYAMSEIYKQEDEEEKRIQMLNLSVKASVDDDYQKGLSFLTLGRLYFDDLQYEPAQLNYDSAVQYLPEDFPDRGQIVKLAGTLTELVEQIRIIRTEDSLQRLSALPKAELEAYIEEVLENRKREEQRQKDAALAATTGSGDVFETLTADNSNQTWYFYSEQSVQRGKNEFKRMWGGRANEDDWRRSEKISHPDPFGDPLSADSDSSGTLNQADELALLMKDIPLTETSKAASNERIAEAYYKLGTIYKEKLGDKPHAIGAFRGLLAAYDTSEKHLNAIYQLYRLYLVENRIDSAHYYKYLILAKYPDSEFAAIIENPEQGKTLTAAELSEKDCYDKLLYYYGRGFYQAAVSKADECLEKHPESKLKVKFAYLRALSNLNDGNKEDLITSLQTFSDSYTGTDEANDAVRRIALLKEEKKIEMILPPPAYTYEPDARHLLVVLVPQQDADVNAVKNDLARFNTAYHATKKFEITSIILNESYHMLSVKQFESETKAIEYRNTIKRNRSVLKEINEKKYPYFIISYTNYALFYQDKRIDEYMDFYRMNYSL